MRQDKDLLRPKDIEEFDAGHEVVGDVELDIDERVDLRVLKYIDVFFLGHVLALLVRRGEDEERK